MRKEFIIIISLLCVLVCILFITMCGVFVYMDKNNKRITKDGTDKKISKPNKVDIAENNESSNAERDIADKTLLHYKLNQSSPTQQKIQGPNPVSPPTQQKIRGPNPPPPPPPPQQNIHSSIPPPPPPVPSQPKHHDTDPRSPVRKLPPQNNNKHGLPMVLGDITEQIKKLRHVHINNSDSSKSSESN